MDRVYVLRGAVDNVPIEAIPPKLVQEIDIPKDEPKVDLRPVIITAMATIFAAYLVSRRK